MIRHHAFNVFLVGFILIAIHNIDDLILKGGKHFPLFELAPYLLILILWSKIKDMILGFLLMLLGFLELQHTIVTHIPALLAEGMGRITITAILYDIGAVLFIVSSIMVYQGWHDKKNKEKIE